MKTTTNHISTLMKTQVVCILIAGFVSCQKNKDDHSIEARNGKLAPGVPVDPAPGFWEGHYRFFGSVVNHDMKVLIKPGGFARVYDMVIMTDTAQLGDSQKTDGTWEWIGDKLEVAFVNDGPFRFTGTVTVSPDQWLGVWRRNGDVKGTFSMSK